MQSDDIAVLIPIVAIIFGVAVAIVAIQAAHRQRMQRADLRHRERIAAIEKGLELPVDPPEIDTAPPRRPRHLLVALVLMFVGAALTVALYQTNAEHFPYLYGLIPVAAGVAYLIYYLIEGRHEVPSQNGTPPELPPR